MLVMAKSDRDRSKNTRSVLGGGRTDVQCRARAIGWRTKEYTTDIRWSKINTAFSVASLLIVLFVNALGNSESVDI